MRAFPQLHTIDGNWQKEPLDEYAGMSLLDHFAGMAMQGYCSDPEWRADMSYDDTAGAAYGMAAAMLKARQRYSHE